MHLSLASSTVWFNYLLLSWNLWCQLLLLVKCSLSWLSEVTCFGFGGFLNSLWPYAPLPCSSTQSLAFEWSLSDAPPTAWWLEHPLKSQSAYRLASVLNYSSVSGNNLIFFRNCHQFLMYCTHCSLMLTWWACWSHYPSGWASHAVVAFANLSFQRLSQKRWQVALAKLDLNSSILFFASSFFKISLSSLSRYPIDLRRIVPLYLYPFYS